MAITSLEDPTTPVGSDYLTESTSLVTDQKPAESFFMRMLHEELDSFAINTRKKSVLLKEIAQLSSELKEKSQLGTADYEKLDQLASASDRLKEADKAIGSAEGKLSLYAPNEFKELLLSVPFKVEVEGVKIKISASDFAFGGEARIKIETE
jgi:hypothetical protein